MVWSVAAYMIDCSFYNKMYLCNNNNDVLYFRLSIKRWYPVQVGLKDLKTQDYIWCYTVQDTSATNKLSHNHYKSATIVPAPQFVSTTDYLCCLWFNWKQCKILQFCYNYESCVHNKQTTLAECQYNVTIWEPKFFSHTMKSTVSTQAYFK